MLIIDKISGAINSLAFTCYHLVDKARGTRKTFFGQETEIFWILTLNTLLGFGVEWTIWWTVASGVDYLLIRGTLAIHCDIVKDFALFTRQTVSFVEIVILVIHTGHTLTTIIQGSFFWTFTQSRCLVISLFATAILLGLKFMKSNISLMRMRMKLNMK